MNPLVTAIFLALTVLGAAGCDSNPVPHPGQNNAEGGGEVYTPGVVTGGADASEPPDRNTDEDDLDPTTDNGEGGYAGAPCDDASESKTDVDADVVDGDGAEPADVADADDNETDASEPDCGPTEEPPPSGAADQDQVEDD